MLLMVVLGEVQANCIECGRVALLENDLGPLFEEHKGHVNSILLRYGVENLADREDLLQEVFLMAVRKIFTLREPRAFPGWIGRIAERLAINFHKRRSKFTSLEIPEEDDRFVNFREPSAPENVMLMETCAEVRKAMRMLSPMDQSVLRKFYIQGETLENIRIQLSVEEQRGIPTGTVKRRLHVARNRIRKALDQRASPGVTAPLPA